MIKTAIIDDHKMFSDGVRSILNQLEDIDLIWSAANTDQTLTNIKNQKPDVVLMDISLGDESGFILTKQLLNEFPDLKILALTMHQEDNYIVKILELGACGYILKDAGGEEMVRAIRTVYNGDSYYSKHVSEVLIKHITKGTKPKERSDGINLTKREEEVLKLIADEFTNPEIAKILFISIRTVDTHRRNLLDKLNVKNTAGLVRYALKHGLTK